MIERVWQQDGRHDRRRDSHQDDLLEQYWSGLRASPAPPVPDGLDPAVAAVAAGLDRHLRPPDPDPAFAVALWQRLEAAATALPQNGMAPAAARWWHRRPELPAPTPVRRWPLAGLATAAVLALALAGTTLLASRPQPASAARIVARTQAVAADSAAAGVRSFALSETHVSRRPNGERLEGETRRWYQAPDRWRLEYETRVVAPDGRETRRHTGVTASDGADVWQYDPQSETTTVRRATASDAGTAGTAGTTFTDWVDFFVPASGRESGEMPELLARAGTCYRPALGRDEKVAGRPAYVVDLGPSRCPSASAPESNGRRVLWIDKETFFVLRSVLYGAGGQPLSTSEVTRIAYNDAIDAARFSFTPPPDAAVRDQRLPAAAATPVPAKSDEPAGLALDELRRRLAFPVFVPTWLPEGLTPEPPVGAAGKDGGPGASVRITYHAADGSIALQVLNGPAGCCLDADDRKGGQEVALPGGLTAHFLPNAPQHGGPILWWQQEGTYVALSGPHRTREELAKVAASVSSTAGLGRTEPVAARPDPTPVPPPPFAVLRPSWLPEPMVVHEEHQQIVTPDGPTSLAVLRFDARTGANPRNALTLMEQPAASSAGPRDPEATRERIGGRDVTVVRRGSACMTLTWVQDDVALTLTSSYDPPGQPRYSCEQLRRVVESVR